ncbi:substrate-binding periplasmic protein [Brevibacillus sp. TJ4]|uniref:substrate-binding periplasmic protein n=1 Tax=Brevibacillus sp. TJ4 TaxID=3234853 RepID=UPI0037D84086
MKKGLKIGLIAVLSSLMLAACGGQASTPAQGGSASGSQEAAGTLAQIKEKGVLTVITSNDAPFSYIDTQTQEYTGIDAEIITEIAKRLGIEKVDVKIVKFENMLLELNNKNGDIVADAMWVKPEREKIVNFTDLWYRQADGLIVQKDDDSIKGLDDLADKVVGGQKGTTFLELLNEMKSEGKVKDVVVFGSQAELVLAINTKKIDAALTDMAVTAFTIKNDPSLNVKMVSPYTAHFDGPTAAAVRKEDTDLLEAVNAELAKLKEEGFVLEVLKKYGLGEDNMAE